MMQMEQEVIKTIPEFPRYEISSYGRVFNRETGRELTNCHVQYGIVSVSLLQDVEIEIDGYLTHKSVQKTRSVKSLVARTFVEGETDRFNTPIQLDGNRDNLHVSNIVWRPRWFAIRYTRQFYNQEPWFNIGPIVDVRNELVYENVFRAAISNGLLCEDIRKSIYNGKQTFPNGLVFERLKTE